MLQKNQCSELNWLFFSQICFKNGAKCYLVPYLAKFICCRLLFKLALVSFCPEYLAALITFPDFFFTKWGRGINLLSWEVSGEVSTTCIPGWYEKVCSALKESNPASKKVPKRREGKGASLEVIHEVQEI